MKPGGCLAVVSYSDPKNRQFLFEGKHLSLKVERFKTRHPSESLVNNIYICKKLVDADGKNKANIEIGNEFDFATFLVK